MLNLKPDVLSDDKKLPADAFSTRLLIRMMFADAFPYGNVDVLEEDNSSMVLSKQRIHIVSGVKYLEVTIAHYEVIGAYARRRLTVYIQDSLFDDGECTPITAGSPPMKVFLDHFNGNIKQVEVYSIGDLFQVLSTEKNLTFK